MTRGTIRQTSGNLDKFFKQDTRPFGFNDRRASAARGRTRLLVTATCRLHRPQFSARFDSIQLIAPVFFKRALSLVTASSHIGIAYSVMLLRASTG
jgi:hypothetical protein